MAALAETQLIRRPKVRIAIRMANVVGRNLRAFGFSVGDLSEDTILQAARRRSRLEDLGDERFRLPLRALLDSYEHDSNLTFVGRMIAQGMMIHHVANRMRIHHDLQQHPEILEGEIRRPLFVVGLPRTGTTLLYGLLAQDPASRPLLFWESMSPSPPPDPQTRDRDPRIRTAERTVARLNRAVPTLRFIHEMNPRAPDECLGLLLNTFVTPFFRGRLPRYREWLYGVGDEEVLAAYHEYRQQLLLLQWRCSGDHWVLKCPSHLFGLKALLAVFPDACLVHTHRDPTIAVPSLCSLTAALDGMSYKMVDMQNVGERDLEIIEQLIDRGMKARSAAKPGQIYDIHYQELVRDPLAAIRRIYEHFGYDYNTLMEEKVKVYLAANPQHKHGVHAYNLDEFGLSREALRIRFSAYCHHFGIESE